jgi:hypothetical protein
VSARRVLLALLAFFTLLTVALATTSVAAQSASPTAVPTDPPGGTDDWTGLLVVLLGLLVAGGLVLTVVATAVSVALVELFGPFRDGVHLALPTLVGGVPLAVFTVTATFGVELLWPLYLAALVALPTAGLLVRRRYR